MVLFYDSFWANSKNISIKTVGSARKPVTREDLKNKYPIASRKSSVSITHCDKSYDHSKSLNSVLQNESNNYKDEVSGSKHEHGHKYYNNNLRRKILNSSAMNHQLSISKVCTPIKKLNFESSMLKYRREKPDNVLDHKLTTSKVHAKSIALGWNLEETKFSKVPLTTTARKNAEQIANALKRLSDLE
jgi:hypothetical protein